MTGRPSVTFTASPNAACLSTGNPWSWNIARTASPDSSARGVKSVSAGYGPETRIPSRASASTTGAITSISSRPRWPASPACGLSPATRMRGAAMWKRSRRSRSRMRSVSSRPARVMARETSARGRCVVARATRNVPPTRSITTRAVPVRAARYSVWPVNAIPASLIVLFCTGAVTIAANSRATHPSSARSMSASTWRAFAASSRPGCTGAATGQCRSDTGAVPEGPE